MRPIINVDEVVARRHARGDEFEALDGAIGPTIGAKQLGCSLIVVPPGKRAYPFHCHHVNEEMFFVIRGRGIVRIGAHEHPIRGGDVIGAPAGGRETAHQIVNTGDDELAYLAVSTMVPSEVLEYPDSDKVAVYVGGAPGEDPSRRTFSWRGRLAAALDYWDGEA